jgi:hypothetical protein
MMDRKLIDLYLIDAGFILDNIRKSVYILEKNKDISPAFVPNITSRMGKLQIGGGIGLYFEDFEIEWRNSLSKEDRKIDRSLPMVIAIDNFIELVDNGIFRPTDNNKEIERIVSVLFDKCSTLPNSIDDFSRCLDACNILNKNVFQYIHYYSEIDEGNLYFSKSASFTFWLGVRWPELPDKILSCLDSRTSNLMLRYRRDLR